MEKPTSILIFGASGDLTQRKLVPALYNLYLKKRLPEHFHVLGTSRSAFSHDAFREKMREGAKEFSQNGFDNASWEDFASQLYYLPGNMTETSSYQELDALLTEVEGNPANRLYYLATSPEFFPEAICGLGGSNMLTEDHGWRRVIIEKPFGHDLPSAQNLNKIVHSELNEHQVYRIDHYLAKETVQNILVFRFGNTIFEPLWNRNYVDHIQITAAEMVDVGHRGGYYDQSGILRDMFQNHLLQLLALVAMEAPVSFNADALRNEKVKLLSAVRPILPGQLKTHTVRAQYEGYTSLPGVAPESQTPTFAALKFYIDNWRWQGVPFYLRSGKALAEKDTEIIVQFKEPPHMMFPLKYDERIRANYLSLSIQPDEGIHLRFEAKVPDTIAEMRSVIMDFHYADTFGKLAIPEAYERLLLNALNGDASLFTRADGIEQSWKIIDPILKAWETDDAPPMRYYPPGSWGPHEAEQLMESDGRRWLCTTQLDATV